MAAKSGEAGTAQPTAHHHKPRRGRPRADQAGQVELRILDAATELFLGSGFSRTTFDQIADAAHTSKTTLYERFPSKEALFTAVVDRHARTFLAHISGGSYKGTLERRLVSSGLKLADATLTPDSITLMRITFAEANAFPSLAQLGFRIAFTECVRVIAEAVADDQEPAAVETATPLATRFVELALHPLYMHAFFGADLDQLRKRARVDIPAVAGFLTQKSS